VTQKKNLSAVIETQCIFTDRGRRRKPAESRIFCISPFKISEKLTYIPLFVNYLHIRSPIFPRPPARTITYNIEKNINQLFNEMYSNRLMLVMLNKGAAGVWVMPMEPMSKY